VRTSPLVGGLLGAGVGLGVLICVAAWSGLLDRTPGASRRAAVDRAGLRAALALAGAAVAFWLTGWLAASAALAFAGWTAPSIVGLRARRREERARTEAVAAWAEMLRDLLTSSAGLQEAIGKSARVVPPAISAEVSALYVRAQRGELAGALRRFAADLANPIADTVVAALLIAERRVASDLGGMLAAVAASTRETVAMELRVAAARARIYRTSQLIAIIVGFFIGVLVITNRDYMEPFGTVTGQLVLIAVVGLIVAAIWTMLSLSRPSQTVRLLDVESPVAVRR
jgi:hypothetical protein